MWSKNASGARNKYKPRHRPKIRYIDKTTYKNGTKRYNKEIQNWILAEEESGRKVDMNRINERLREITRLHNSMPLSDFNGLSPEEMRHIIYYPFSSRCVVNINNLGKE